MSNKTLIEKACACAFSLEGARAYLPMFETQDPSPFAEDTAVVPTSTPSIIDAFFADEAPVKSKPVAAEAATIVAVTAAAAAIEADASLPAAAAQVDTTVPAAAAAAVAPTIDAPATKLGPDLFAALGLCKPLLSAVRELGFTKPTAVQEKTIPLAMKSQASGAKYSDLMVSSQTGSGKTAAYLLPVLHTLYADLREQQAEADKKRQAEGGDQQKSGKRGYGNNNRNFKAATPGALILCPTRELAQQVANDAIDLVRDMPGIRISTVIGGLPYQQQIARLQNASLVVATPGRLLDLQRSRQIKCESVKFLVVDEADRMLDLGFADDLAEINQLTIERQQTMMFSATFEARIQGLAKRVMREPQRITIDTPQERHANIKQALFWADNLSHKRKVLDHLMRDVAITQAIVFASTQIECDGLAADLVDAGFSAGALHGALSQRLRNTRLGLLREGRIQFLVATDVAARGIDVPNISHIFNYGLPMKAEDYVHRIGRTGRAGRNGIAVTIAEHRDRRKIGDIEHYTKQRLNAETIPGLEPQGSSRVAPTRKEREKDRSSKRYGSGNAGSFGGGDAERRPAPARDYAAPRGNFEAKPRGYSAPSGGSDSKPRGYGAPNGGFDAKPRGYSAPYGGSDSKPRGYAAPGGSDAKPRGYGAPNGGSDSKPRGYGAPYGGSDSKPRGYGAPGGGFDAKPRGGTPGGSFDAKRGARPFVKGPRPAHAGAQGAPRPAGPFDDKRHPNKKALGR